MTAVADLTGIYFTGSVKYIRVHPCRSGVQQTFPSGENYQHNPVFGFFAAS
jgi:hypothetical protein